MNINKDTQLCMSLSGRPGNFGTRFQNFLYQELDLNFIYKAFTTQDIRSAIAGIRSLGIRGCAISMPFKEACMEYLDEIDLSAQGIKSVNTIVNNNGCLKGYNTDYTAIYQLLKSNEISPSNRFAILGSGGMAKAVVCALKDLGFQNGLIIARNKKSGSELAHQYGYSWQPILGENYRDVLINVTPIGMAGGVEAEDLSFSVPAIEAAKFIFDVVAIPTETPLIQKARASGKTAISGAEIIILQAVEQFVLYTGIRPSLELTNRAAAFARHLPSQ